jgi:hypothetical protein
MAYTTIDKPTDYFNTKLYTGTGATHNITGVGFQPDWSWLKCRSNLEGHELYDSVRGVTKMLTSNSDSAESTQSTALTSFDSDGFTLGSDFEVNASGRTFVSWNWLAGGTASSNTDGSITSSVSANTTSGFSIVSYAGNSTAGATVGHGLGSAIKFLWVKNRDDSGENHTIWHQDIPNTNALFLNSTDASASYTTRWNSTTPTSSVFTVGTSNGVNGSGKNYIAYCFAEKKGYSKFGSYTGNGNADGTFVYTGFKPAFIITKSSSTGGTYYNWGMWDTARSPSNVNNKILAANTSDDESNPSNLGANQNIDFLSNGFKHRSADVVNNQSGVTYIYMAFAESPFVTSSGIPTCAR